MTGLRKAIRSPTAEQRERWARWELLGSLLCERCEVGTIGRSDWLDSALFPYCRECLDHTLGAYPPWYVVTDKGWEPWTICDVDRRSSAAFPWEDWIEEGRVRP